MAKPFIKWAGGKEKELCYIIPKLPKDINNYIEPFLGGGAVFLAFDNIKISGEKFVNDFSQELIALYNAISSNDKKFFNYLKDIEHNWNLLSVISEKYSFNFLEIYNAYKVTKNKQELKDSISEFMLHHSNDFNGMLEMSIDDVKKDYYEFRKWNMSLSKYQLLDYMMKVDETLTEAYYLKEAYRDFNRYNRIHSEDDRDIIRIKLNEFINLFHTSSSPELRRFGVTLSNWQIEILNSFIYIDEWRLSNAKIENINGQIKNLMAISYGFTNFERTRTRIIYTINKDYPFSIIKKYDSKQRKKKN